VWELLSPWLGPDDAELTRFAVYEFRGLLARTMRDARVFLAGDAAHLMPPFLGQGLCSGIRDASNLAWKLDLALRGQAGEALLDSYTAERKPHCEWIVRMSMEMARVSCVLDSAAAAERDAAMRATETPPPLGLPRISDGLLQEASENGPSSLAGTLAAQGTVAGPAGEGRFDDIVGRGFVLLTTEGDPRAAVTPEQLAFLNRLETRFVSLDPAAEGGVRDIDGRLRTWLHEHDAAAVVVRPDFYVFGALGSTDELPALVDDLRQQLMTRQEATHG
jgi:hypothetical protein